MTLPGTAESRLLDRVHSGEITWSEAAEIMACAAEARADEARDDKMMEKGDKQCSK